MEDDYLEYEKKTKSLKSINLENFSIEDLKEYNMQLENEINRVEIEIDKKLNLQKDAEKYFK